MQFKISFQLQQPGQLLPLSYQYELSAWIYKLISASDSAFGRFLHTQGYTSNNKRFKFFTFSSLYVPEFEIQGDRMKILSPNISFVVSFLVQQAAQDMIIGLFQNQQLRLGDRISQVDLSVEQVHTLPTLKIEKSTVKLRATSPLLVSQPEEKENGKLQHQYLSPAQKNYSHYFWKNLFDKHHTAQKHQLIGDWPEKPVPIFRLLSTSPKKRGIRIKAFTDAETKIIGYMYDFELTAPPEIIRMGMLAGFGGENALGFGATRIIG